MELLSYVVIALAPYYVCKLTPPKLFMSFVGWVTK